MFFTSIKEINRLRKERNRLLSKEIPMFSLDFLQFKLKKKEVKKRNK